MFKFLRKYNKWILAVGGGLLMIVFLLGDTLPRLTGGAGAGRATRAVVGHETRERVPAREWARYGQEADFIRSLEQRGEMLFPQLGPIQSTEHWFLLVREARAAGLIGSPGSVNVTDELLFGLGATALSPDIVRSALANFFGVQRMLDLYENAGEISDRRLKNYATRIFHAVDADVAVIAAASDRSDNQPTEDELAAHLDRFKEYRPGEGPMGLGYRLPNRVKIEWLTITVDSIERALAESDELSGVALRMHWSRNPDGEFPEVERGQPVPDQVREDLLQRLTEERTARIETYAAGQLAMARRGVPQRDGYYVLPENWPEQRTGLPQLAQNVQERLDIPLPDYQAIGDRWLDLNEVGALPGIGRATTDRFGTPPRNLRDLVAAAKEFGGSMTMAIQSGVAGPPLRDRDGNLYFFRMIDADPSRPPASVDEVREELVVDLRRIAAYEDLAARRSAMEQIARERGVLAAAIEFDAEFTQQQITLTDLQVLQIQAQLGRPLNPMPSELPVIGSHRPTVEAIIDHAMSLPQDVPVSSLPRADRILVIPVEDHLSIAIAGIKRQQPLTRETYAEFASAGVLQRLMLSEELDGREKVRDAFSYETLARRHNLEVTRPRDEFDEVEVEATLGG